ncbi:MAG: gamma-glutamylcyclotransferase [Alphaproteobacteria bacterium]|nr:gamma-glutamylcyclotransferase [Alphaproteobacteria bacterium]
MSRGPHGTGRGLDLRPHDDGTVWVFGYGSLMWNPGFAHEHRAEAVLSGYRRRLCVFSHNHRGTPERPGLVMGLDLGGACRGTVYRADPAYLAETVDYLAERELIYAVYRPHVVPVRLRTGPRAGERILANTFVCDRAHPHYAGRLTPEDAARIVAGATGERGPALEYLVSAVASLRRAGTPDRSLERLLDRAQTLHRDAA